LQGDPALRGIFVTGGIAAAVKIHSDGGSFLLKMLATAIGAEDQERNGPLYTTTAAEIGILGRTRARCCRGMVHLFTSRIWMLLVIHLKLILGLQGVWRRVRINEVFPDLFLPRPGSEYKAEEQGSQDGSNCDP
jgi:hypothetical protein